MSKLCYDPFRRPLMQSGPFRSTDPPRLLKFHEIAGVDFAGYAGDHGGGRALLYV